MIKKNKSLYFLLSVIPFFTVIFILFSCIQSSGSEFGTSGSSPLRNDSEIRSLEASQNALNKIYELYRDRVVYISTEQTVNMPSHPFFNDPFFNDFFGNGQKQYKKTQKRTGLGSGFIISKDGYIATNHHVVNNVDRVTVRIDNKSYDAKVIGSDEVTDLALLKIDSSENLNPVYFGNSDDVKVGDYVVAIGNPFGLERTFTTGVVSFAARKDVDLTGGSKAHIQTDASINPGNSGGPLINIYGEVIGMNRMIYSKSGGNMGIGFAIPINRAESVLNELRENGKIRRGHLGVQIVPLTEDYAKQLGLDSNEGVLVGAVMNNSPAEKGGVKVGDLIIKVDGEDIKDYRDLIDTIEKTKINETIKLVVVRDKSKVALFVTIKERP